MICALGGDHAGFPLKAHVKGVLEALGHDVIDHGCFTPDPVDFPDVARLVCDSVRSGRAERGIMVCGTGVGASIAANKIPGIRASVCHDAYSAHQCVEHDDANVLCLGAQVVGPAVIAELVTTYVAATFSTEEHFRRRVRKIRDLEYAAAAELAGKPR